MYCLRGSARIYSMCWQKIISVFRWIEWIVISGIAPLVSFHGMYILTAFRVLCSSVQIRHRTEAMHCYRQWTWLLEPCLRNLEQYCSISRMNDALQYHFLRSKSILYGLVFSARNSFSYSVASYIYEIDTYIYVVYLLYDAFKDFLREQNRLLLRL